MAEHSSTSNTAPNQGPGIVQSAVESAKTMLGGQQSPNDSPDRAQGRWEQTVGSAKETLGGLTGHEGLKQQGAEQRRAGEQQEAMGQVSDLGKGAADRAEGAVRSAIAGLTGDHEERAKWDAVHDRGKEVQRSAEKEVERQTAREQEAARH